MAQVDGRELSVELRRQFPEVPLKVIEEIMHMNSNNRELCFTALSTECQRYQENLYGPAVAVCENLPLEGQQSNHAQGGDVGLQRSDSRASSGRHSSGSQGAEQQDTPVSSFSTDPWLHHSSHLTYTPQFSAISSSPSPADSSRSSQPVSTPPSNAMQHMVYGAPFVHSFNPRDPRFYGPYFSVMPGAPFRGDSVFGAFGSRPRTFDPHYSPFQVRNFPTPYVSNPLLMQPIANFPGSAARSPIPFSPYQNASYYREPFQSLSASQLPFGGTNIDESSAIMHHLNQPHCGSPSISTVGLSYHNQQDMLVGPQPQSGLGAGLSQENLTADVLKYSSSAPVYEMLPNNHPAKQLSCPGSATSSRSGSLVGEDLAYAQALIVYQKARLDAFLADLGRQKNMLGQLRKEVGQLQQESLNRRLSKNDIFPTAIDRQKMLTENQNLEMQIRLLTYEIDIANGDSRLGWLDSQDQRFHDAISTGQSSLPVSTNIGADLRPPHPLYLTQNSSPTGQPSYVYARVFRPVKPARPPPPYAPLPPSIVVPPDSDDGENWSCSACTFLNHPLLNKCECCEMPKLPAMQSASR